MKTFSSYQVNHGYWGKTKKDGSRVKYACRKFCKKQHARQVRRTASNIKIYMPDQIFNPQNCYYRFCGWAD